MRPIRTVEFEMASADVGIAVAANDLLSELRAVNALNEMLREIALETMSDARARGHSWDQIAAALGVSRQAAQKRSGHRPRAR